MAATTTPLSLADELAAKAETTMALMSTEPESVRAVFCSQAVADDESENIDMSENASNDVNTTFTFPDFSTPLPATFHRLCGFSHVALYYT